MAKKSKIEKNKKRIATANRNYAKRKELQRTARNTKLSIEERAQAANLLQKMPRDTSIIRSEKRCMISGRPRGVYSIGMSRHLIREYAFTLPGLKKV